MHVRLVGLVGLVACVVMAVTGAASGSTASQPPDITALGLPSGYTSEAVTAGYTVIVDSLFLPHPEEWGGAYIDGKTLVVNTVTRNVDEAAKVLKSLGVNVPVKIVQVDVSMDDLDAATAAVAGDASLAGTFTSVGPDYSHSRLVVGVASSSAKSADAAMFSTALENQLGRSKRGSIDVVVFDGGTPVATSRYYDTSPFYGGDNLNFKGPSGGSGCSGGFSWTSASKNYIVSASHCAWTPSDARLTVSRVLSNSTIATIGSVTWTSGGNAGTSTGKHGDLALVQLSTGLSNSARVFVGTYNTTSTRIVKDRLSLPQGAHYSNLRSSGAGPFYGNGDGEIDPDWISLVNQTISYTNGQTYKNLTFAEDNTDCFGGGDSGGAMYLQRADGGADAIGIISGTNGQGGGLTNCRNYYTPLEYVASDFGGAVKTG